MSSLSDILTAVKNIPSAINALAQTYISVQGSQNFADISSATVVKATAGRVATVVVTTAGSATGKIYDQNIVTGTTRILYVIPMTVGVFFVNMPTAYGIVVAPGTGQVVTVSYS